MSQNTTSHGYIVLLISVSMLIIIQAMAIGRDNNSLERPMLSVSNTFNAPEFTAATPSAPFVPDHFEPGALSKLPGEDQEGQTDLNSENDTEINTLAIIAETEPENTPVEADQIEPETSTNFEELTVIDRNTTNTRENVPPVNESYGTETEPIKESASAAPTAEEYLTYTIKKGDSLWLIANIYKTSVSKLMKWNEINPNDSLQPGRELRVYGNQAMTVHKKQLAKAKAIKTAPPSRESKSQKSLTYNVKKGDNLIGIAKKFHTSVASLLISNNLDDPGKLRPGQVLKISEAAEIIHVVNKGESLWELGKLYSIKLSKLIEHNDLKYKTIFPGQKLTIPVHSAVKLEQIYRKRRQKSLNSKFRSPLRGRLCGYYGWRIHPILKKRLFHCGVDLAARKGTPINAIGAGEVTFAGWLKGYGKVVVVKHGRGLSSRYAHCNTIKTKVGAKIKAGQTIAKVGTTGLSTGPHLHLEVRKFGHPVDPAKFVAI